MRKLATAKGKTLLKDVSDKGVVSRIYKVWKTNKEDK